MKQYRIGEFAKYLGVTPDLLKHYEELGILKPERSKSGYRYYPFNTTTLLLESIRLRNYGMTLRQIQEVLAERTVPTKKVEERFKANMELLKMENRLNQALIEDYEEFLSWKEPLENTDSDWSIRWSRPMYFLPHAVGDDFLDDPAIYEILRDWMSHIPLVKSSARIEMNGTRTWGLVIEKRTLEQMQIPINEMVQEIPRQRVFYYQFKGKMTPVRDEKEENGRNPAFALLRSMNLRPAGVYYRTTVMPCDWRRGMTYQYGYYAIPIEMLPENSGDVRILE